MKVQAFACEVLDKLPASFLKLSHINRWIFSKSFSQVFASEFAWSRRLETTQSESTKQLTNLAQWAGFVVYVFFLLSIQ